MIPGPEVSFALGLYVIAARGRSSVNLSIMVLEMYSISAGDWDSGS